MTNCELDPNPIVDKVPEPFDLTNPAVLNVEKVADVPAKAPVRVPPANGRYGPPGRSPDPAIANAPDVFALTIPPALREETVSVVDFIP